MQSRQAKSHTLNTAPTKTAEALQKAAVSAASASRVPAWTGGMNDQIPPGLALQDASAVPGLQAKLAISQPNDPYEQEADKVAEQVMRKPETGTPVTCNDISLMRKGMSGTANAPDAPPIVHEVLRTEGQPLSKDVQASMEAGFAQDFSQVRVHTDGQAAESTKSVSALAYTVGNDVVFGKGRYQPETSEGQKLLAHELTHVVQQGSASASKILHRAPVGPEPSAGGQSEPLQISATTFDEAAKNFADILREQNLQDPARIIVINGANLRVYDELGNGVVGSYPFRVMHDVDWPAGVFRQLPQDRRLHAIIRLANGGYSISSVPAHGSVDVDFSRDISDQDAFNSAISGGKTKYYVIPKIAASPPSSEPTTPPPSQAPEFARFVPTDKANLEAWPAAVIPLTPQVATVHSTGSFMMHVEKNQGVNTLDRVTNLMEPTNFRWEVLLLDEKLHVTGQQDVSKLAGIKEGYARRIRNVQENQETLLGDHPEQQSIPEQVAREFIAAEMGGAEAALAMAGQTAMTIINTITSSPDNPNIENIIDVPWDKPGDYFVRCLATPVASNEAKYRRATSVAGVMVTIYDIAELASSSLLSAEEERAAAQKTAKSYKEELAQLKRQQAMRKGDQVELDIQIHLLQARINFEQEKITAAGDTRAMKEAELNYVRALIAYFSGPDLPKSKKAQEKADVWLKELRTNEKDVSDLLERADHRLGDDTKQKAVMSAVFVDEVTGQRYPLTFTIGEQIRINTNELEVRIADITREEGRVFSGSGTGWTGEGRAVAWQNAMRDLRRNLNRGRGWLAFRPPSPYASLPLDLPNPMQLQIAGLDQLKEMVDDAAHAATLLALLAAPFTEGASLGILAVLAPIQAASSLYNIVNRAMYDDLHLDSEAVMDFINIATFGLGHISDAGHFATKSVQIAVASGKVALRLLEAGTYLVITYQTYQQLTAEGPPDEDPRARQRRRLMALLNLAEAAGIPVAEHLWPEGMRPSSSSVEAPPTEKPLGAGESSGVGSQEADREGAPAHTPAEGVHPRIVAAPRELVEALGDLQSHVPIEVDTSLEPGTVRVHYEQDLNGLIREIKVRVGTGATARDIELHLPTIRMMNRYSGFSGRVRLLLEQLHRWLSNPDHSAPPVGSRAWEAKLELEKLPAIISDRARQLESGSLDPATEQQLLTELEDLQAQLAEHARILDAMDLDPGRGYVAAEGVNMGKQIAADRGYPDPPEGYIWRWKKGQLEVVNQGDGPKLVFDPETKSFSPDTAVSKEESFGPGTTREQAFKDLGGDDPTSPFGKFIEVLRKEGIITSSDEVREAIEDPSNLTRRTVRSNVKENFKDKLMAHITDARRLGETKVYEDVLNTTHDPEQALRAASEVEMIRITDMLDSADKGSIADRWYEQMYGQAGSKRQVSISKEAMRKQGIKLEQDRQPDRVEGDTIRELKNVSDELGSRDKEQILDYLKLVGAKIMVDNEARQINKLAVSFLDPRGVLANLEWMQGTLATSTRISFEIFNASGVGMEITSANKQFLGGPDFYKWLGLKD